MTDKGVLSRSTADTRNLRAIADDIEKHTLDEADGVRTLRSIADRFDSHAWCIEDDEPLPEDAVIDAAFPTRSGSHKEYAEAMRMVGAKRSKAALVAKARAEERAAIVADLRKRAKAYRENGFENEAAALQQSAHRYETGEHHGE